ncbi:chloride channel CLIC-like protein 1 isoform X2 [Scyliorhinus canicula]|uniref:chloride channel CLIC-like protein 1 isoform X2 n=1 Tax=Scyliorhinus canicula TaxID=7830 RepID=UPI0018F77504|nr:chloride channel CLIC-like protein 1 isoform X2 [Scyliorhinus canicula]
MFVPWLIFEVLLVVNGLPDDDDEWIDPTDMLNYDAATGRMRKPQETRIMESATETLTTEGYTEGNRGKDFCPDCSTCERQLDNLQKRFEEYRKTQSVESTEIGCNPVFKRYLNKLLLETGKLGLPDDNSEVHYDAEILISKQDVTEMKKFLSDKTWKAGALDDALSKLLINFKFHDHEAWKWRFEDTFGVDPSTAFLTAFAKRQADFAKLQLDKPMCTGVQNMDWKGSLAEWFRRTWTLENDPCEAYYKALLVDPILEVPPTKALMLTVTSMITEPLKHIGQPIGQFFRDLLKDLPWLWQFPVALTVILAVVAFFYSCGHAVVRYGFTRSFPNVGPQAPIAYHNVPPYRLQGLLHNSFYQREGYVDYQAGGDASHVPRIRRVEDHDAIRPGDVYHHGVEDLMNWERAGMPNNGIGDQQLRRRRVPDQKDCHCTRYTSKQLASNNGVFATTIPQTPEENAGLSVIEDNDVHQTQGIIEKCESHNFQNKKATDLPINKLGNQLQKESRAGKEEMQNNVREELGTTNRPLDAVLQLPSGKNVIESEVIDKKNVQERKFESEISSVENVGAQAFTNLERTKEHEDFR